VPSKSKMISFKAVSQVASAQLMNEV